MSNIKRFSSRKEVSEFLATKGIDTSNWSEVKWLSLNKGQAEIHMSLLAEAIYDTMNESKPRELKPGQWHIPFGDTFDVVALSDSLMHSQNYEWSATTAYKDDIYSNVYLAECAVAISTALAARVSYTTIDSKDTEHTSENYIKLLSLHDRLISQEPKHSSPLEHCAKCMSDEEYETHYKGILSKGLEYYHPQEEDMGWSRNFKGFKSYRQILEEC